MTTVRHEGAKQRSRRRSRLLVGAVLAATIAGSAVLAAGCGGDDGDDSNEVASPVGGFSSPYCVTARNWAVHELNGGGDGAYARGGPPALRKWWKEQLAYLKTSLEQAPPAVRAAEAKNERFIRTRLTPLITRYGFNAERVGAEASSAEQALLDHPPPDLVKAQQVRNRYQDRVCGYGGEPPAAAVTFKATPAAKPYCEAVGALVNDLQRIASSGFDPKATRSYIASGKLDKALDEQDEKAPPAIAADVKADTEWARTRQLDVWKKFDYDLRRVLREASAEEVAAFTYWDEAIAEQHSRVSAYQEQVCGA